MRTSTPAATTAPTIGVITNPNSKKNRNRERLAPRLQAILGERGLVRETHSTDEIPGVIEEFLDRRITYWVSDGGDGALHWMLNQAHDVLERRHPGHGLEATGRELPFVLPTNGGTIDFVAKRAGVRGQAEDLLKRLVALQARGERPADALVPTLVASGRRLDPATGALVPFELLGFAAAVAGIGQGFFGKYYLDPVPGPKTMVRVISSAAASWLLDQSPLAALAPARAAAYHRDVIKRVPATVHVDGRRLPFREYTALHVGAIPIDLGGLVKVFHHARGGALHVMAGAATPWEMIVNLPRLFAGRKVLSRRLYDAPARDVRIVAPPSAPLDPVMDGEFIRGVVDIAFRPGPRVRIPRIAAR